MFFALYTVAKSTW